MWGSVLQFINKMLTSAPAPYNQIYTVPYFMSYQVYVKFGYAVLLCCYVMDAMSITIHVISFQSTLCHFVLFKLIARHLLYPRVLA